MRLVSVASPTKSVALKGSAPSSIAVDVNGNTSVMIGTSRSGNLSTRGASSSTSLPLLKQHLLRNSAESRVDGQAMTGAGSDHAQQGIGGGFLKKGMHGAAHAPFASVDAFGNVDHEAGVLEVDELNHLACQTFDLMGAARAATRNVGNRLSRREDKEETNDENKHLRRERAEQRPKEEKKRRKKDLATRSILDSREGLYGRAIHHGPTPLSPL